MITLALAYTTEVFLRQGGLLPVCLLCPLQKRRLLLDYYELKKVIDTKIHI